MDFWWLLALIPITFGAAGAYMDSEKGRSPVEGFALGVLFGPLAWIIVFVLPNRENTEFTAEGQADRRWRPLAPRAHFWKHWEAKLAWFIASGDHSKSRKHKGEIPLARRQSTASPSTTPLST
ncbi:MAG: hypothetical protein P4L85_19640 [Paludisphaera borealis]|uniref:hypothetical protein n=1 Tax=Paludisphaera borealis TaxID=1387353 RepID=UPI00284E8CF3|nr:hypothetical protein [Paludisphaera borealis]MDR3621574.1 hypothetical protein [Paludisphaera borealis]